MNPMDSVFDLDALRKALLLGKISWEVFLKRVENHSMLRKFISLVFFVSKEELQILGLSFLKNIGALFALESEKKQEGQLGAPERQRPGQPGQLGGGFSPPESAR